MNGWSMLKAAEAWLSENVETGKRRRLTCQRYLVMVHGGQYESRWQVVRSSSQVPAEESFRLWCKRAPRSVIALVACPFDLDVRQLRRLGWEGTDESLQSIIELNSRMRIVDSRLPFVVAHKRYPSADIRNNDNVIRLNEVRRGAR